MALHADYSTMSHVGPPNVDNGTMRANSRENLNNELIFNMAIVLSQLSAFFFILIPRSVKASLRLILVSLTLPGFAQNLSWTAARIGQIWFRGPYFSNEVECKVVLFLSQLGILGGQTSVMGLTLNNFLAVSRPILFRRWMTTAKTFICVACVWSFWIVVNIADIGTRSNSKTPCVPITATSSYVLITEALVILLTTVTVAILNLKIVIKFWLKFKVYPIKTETSSNRAIIQMIGVNSSSLILNMASESITATTSGNTIVTHGSISKTSAVLQNQETLHPNKDASRFPPTPCDQSFLSQPSNTISPDSAQNVSERRVKTPSQPASTNELSKTRLLFVSSQRQSRIRKMGVTLIILTIWNAIGYIPFMACSILSVAQKEGGLSGNFRLFNEVVGTIVRLCIIGNTFIYAWRFINWKNICSQFNSRRVNLP